MTEIESILASKHRFTLSGVPEGWDAWIISELAQVSEKWVLHIARDDARVAVLSDTIKFFCPGAVVLRLPAWDTLPYDRISPNGGICADRVAAMQRLLEVKIAKPSIVLTTVNAVLQKIPSRESIKERLLIGAVGDVLTLDELQMFLNRNGFSRTGTVMEPGEYAVRGDICDVFPGGRNNPVRLDFFGDKIEGVRTFDPLTQRTISALNDFRIYPASEILLNEDSINRFRRKYRELFGAVVDEDPLYTAVSSGRSYPGLENWLPLFHEDLENLFDYMPDSPITLDHLAFEMRDSRLEQIDDFYQSRRTEKKGIFSGFVTYKPLPPNYLYLLKAEWDESLLRRPGGVFSPFAAPPATSVIDFGGRQGRNFSADRGKGDAGIFGSITDRIEEGRADCKRIMIACFTSGSAERMTLVLSDHGLEHVSRAENWPDVMATHLKEISIVVLGIENGLETRDILLISEQDIFGARRHRGRRKSRRAENFISKAAQISTGDIVVHLEHGIARYEGLKAIEVGGAPHDCLQLIYDGNDRLYLPVENIELLSRYGSESSDVVLDRLGGAAWQKRKAKLRERIKETADELIKIAAERLLIPAPIVTTSSGMYDEFCARFPFEETDDQLTAIDDVFGDLSRGAPMDRLICGDVGFGKTEVALRSAFSAVMGGGQVAVVTPTTLLSRQHFNTFQARFSEFPVSLGQLSRLVSSRDAATVRTGLSEGKIDIVIGTHSLLNRKITFKNLTLLIVDEEQHFGVVHKERLKKLRNSVHILTLTATPIPRTLQLAFSGAKDLSLIASPPVDRLSIRTFVMPFDPLIVREAVVREYARGGQTFYVCPRVADLPEAQTFLSEQVPEVKVGIAHGRQSASELEQTMDAFYDGAYDVLLSTNIIESGLDIPTANTIVVHRADMFGLSQLYQLRGRIGRSKTRGYAYLTFPANRNLTDGADKRLKVLQSLDNLGAGFSLASHDLDIRGAGNLLGEEQSGHIREVGFELYQHMLEEALASAKSGEAGTIATADQDWSPNINIGTAVLIPDWYVSDLNVRLELYRRIANFKVRAEIDAFMVEIIDRFGKLPKEVGSLLRIVAIKQLCRECNVEKIDVGPKGVTFVFRDNHFFNPAGLVEFINDEVGQAKLRPDHKLVVRRKWPDVEKQMDGVERLVARIAHIAQMETVSKL